MQYVPPKGWYPCSTALGYVLVSFGPMHSGKIRPSPPPPLRPARPTDRFVSSTLCSIHQQDFFFTPDKLVQSRHKQHCPEVGCSDLVVTKLRSTRIASRVSVGMKSKCVTSAIQSSRFQFIITKPPCSETHLIIFPNAVCHSSRKPQSRGPRLKARLHVHTARMRRTEAWELYNKIMLILLHVTFPFTFSSAISTFLHIYTDISEQRTASIFRVED
jgi:hypothetical protein